MRKPLRFTRSLDVALSTLDAPATTETPDRDDVLVASLASAVRTLQTKVETLDAEVRRLRNKVAFLEGGFEP